MRPLYLAAVLALASPAAAQTTFTVSSTADDANSQDANPGNGTCADANGRCTLRAAVTEANATSGDVTIMLPGQLPGGNSGTYTLGRVAPNDASATFEDNNQYGDLDIGRRLDGSPAAFSSLTIMGTGTPGPSVTIGPNDRVFDVLAGDVTITRVTITGGTAQAGANGVSSPGMGESVDGADGADGGCVLVAMGAAATLDQVSVNNCATQSGGNGASPAAGGTAGGNAGAGGDGGGIANFGTLTVRRSFVAQNGTGDAGSPGAGTAGMSQPVAGGDGGRGGSGGGIYNEGALTLSEVTITGNTAGDPSAGAAGTNGGDRGAEGEGGAGGGVATVNGGTASLRNVLVASNSAGDDTNNDGTGPSATKQPGSDLYDGSVGDTDDGAGPNPFSTGTFTNGGFNLVGTNNTVSGVFQDGQNDTIAGTGQGDASTRINPQVGSLTRNQNDIVQNVPLLMGSPAVDEGASTDAEGNTIMVDGRGFQRPGTREGDSGVDIGAYEFMSQPATMMGNSNVVINEVDADQTGTDGAEFVELLAAPGTSLDGLTLVFFNGNDASNGYRSYFVQDLTGQTTGSDGLFVLCGNDANVSGCDLDVSPNTNLIQNGGSAADAVALYSGSFANNTAATRDGLVDVLVYNVNGNRTPAFLQALGQPVQFVEGYPRDGTTNNKDTESLQRLNDPTVDAGYSGLFYSFAPTPGAANPGVLTVTQDAQVDDVEGYRLLSSPVVNAGLYDGTPRTPLRVDFYAENINLVQGVPAGSPASLFQAQYPDAADILFTDFDADGYVPAPTTGETLAPGEGFLWYWYDQDITAAQAGQGGGGSGTSRSYDLSNPAFDFMVTGIPLDDRIIAQANGQADIMRTTNADGFVLLGNPFAYPFRLGGTSVDQGQLQTTFFAYNPDGGSFVALTAAPDDPTMGDAVAVWNGFIGQVSGVEAGTELTFTATSEAVDPTVQPTFYGRPALAADQGQLRFTLDGTTDSGAHVADGAALVRFSATAQTGWDVADASKPVPPAGAARALVALVGDRDGVPHRQGALSLPTGAAATVPVQFLASEGGQFTLAWTATEGAATATLLDRGVAAGDLSVDGQYAFAADATDWTDRFAVVIGRPVASDDTPDAAMTVSAVAPNPTRGQAAVTVRVAEAQTVGVHVYDALGRRVMTLHEGALAAGADQRFALDTARLAPGVYVVRVAGETVAETRRLTVVR